VRGAGDACCPRIAKRLVAEGVVVHFDARSWLARM
jgi:hypothetical protein